jgi:hypothetical protein
LHEAFGIYKAEDDTQRLRDCFKVLLEENEKECIGALADNMDVILKSYCNEHAATFYVQKLQSGSLNSTPINGIDPKKGLTYDFSVASTAVKSKEEKKAGHSKKQTTILDQDEGGNAICN